MKRFVLSCCLYLVSVCYVDAMQTVPRYIHGKIRLSTIALQKPDLYCSGNLDQKLNQVEEK